MPKRVILGHFDIWAVPEKAEMVKIGQNMPPLE